MNMERILQQAYPVLPVITLTAPNQALPLADALANAGVTVLEITLRTEYGLAAIAEISRQRSDILVGAGSVTETAQLARLVDAGAAFAVSPGFSPELASAAIEHSLPLLPGVMTPSEMLQARTLGYKTLKLFPAHVAGGIDLLKAVAGPLGDLRFCPTGGVGPDNYRDYLALPNVACVGGSWLVPADLLAAGDWAGIERVAREVCAVL